MAGRWAREDAASRVRGCCISWQLARSGDTRDPAAGIHAVGLAEAQRRRASELAALGWGRVILVRRADELRDWERGQISERDVRLIALRAML